MTQAVKASPEHPVLVDRYLTGKEIEVEISVTEIQ